MLHLFCREKNESFIAAKATALFAETLCETAAFAGINPMKQIIVFALVFLSIIHIGKGQALNEAFLNSTVLISYQVDPKSTSSGSGFLVFREIKDNQGQIFLVTNKHVIPPEGEKKSISIRVTTRQANAAKIATIEVPVVGDSKKYLDNVRLHPNKDYDIAVVNITGEVVKNGIDAAWIPTSLFVTKDKLKGEGITVGDEIFLLGYPDAIFDPRNVSPVLREGVISTEPTQGYAFNEKLKKAYGLPDQIDGFLIDANVFPGSSGSLVVLKQQPTTIGPQGQTVVSGAKKIPYVLGIVSASIPIVDVALQSVQRMGLGVVYSADCIKETIELFYK